MNLQYISDSNGQTTGVFIPINEWNQLKDKYKDIDKGEINIPSWHIDIVRERMGEYAKNPDTAVNFGEAMDNIEREL